MQAETPPPPPLRDPATAPTRTGGAAFAALRHRNFRVFYLGHLLSLSGGWMQTTAQGWLALELTNSELLLGVVTAVMSVPTLLFGLYAGVVADRRDKRVIILVAQTFALIAALGLAVLTDLQLIDYGSLLALVFVIGTANAFEVPTRQSFFADLVGEEDLPNAIALNSVAFNATRIVGPAVAGVLIGAVGLAACFYVNAASYLAVIAGLLLMRLPRRVAAPTTSSTLEHLREGLAFIRGDRLVRTLVWLIAAMSMTAFPYVVLLPVFARDVLEVGASGLGWLFSATGAGAMAAGLTLAAGRARVPRGKLIVSACAAFAVLLMCFAISPWFPLSLVLLAFAGFTMILNNASLNALLQSRTPDHLRGRVMSVYVFMFVGTAPVGALGAGALAHAIGSSLTLVFGAGALLVIICTLAWKVPELWEAA